METNEEIKFFGKVLECYKYMEENSNLPTFEGNEKDINLYKWLNHPKVKEKIYHYHEIGNKICSEIVFLIIKFDPNFFDEVVEKQKNDTFLNTSELEYQNIFESEATKEKMFVEEFVINEGIWNELYNQYFLGSTNIDIDEYELFLNEAFEFLPKEFIDDKINNTPILNTTEFKNDCEWNRLKKMFNISHIIDYDINEPDSENTENCTLFLETVSQIFDKEYIRKKLSIKKDFVEDDLNRILRYCNKIG